MKYVDDALTKINRFTAQMRDVKNPVDIISGSVDIDDQLMLLAWNLKVLTKLIYTSGDEVVKLRNSYDRAVFDLMQNLTKETMDEMGIVKSAKHSFSKISCHDELAKYEDMKNKRIYFEKTFETFREWIMIYKKTRLQGVSDD